jgi:hypothetical protein
MFNHGCETIQRLVCATFHRSASSRCARGAPVSWLAPFRTDRTRILCALAIVHYSPPFPCLTVVGRERGGGTSSTQISW